jgi:hypothetical protein
MSIETEEVRTAHMVQLRYTYRDNGQTYCWDGIILDSTWDEALAEAKRLARITTHSDENGGYESIELSSIYTNDDATDPELHDMKSLPRDYSEYVSPVHLGISHGVYFRGADTAVNRTHKAFQQVEDLINGIVREP